MRINDSAACLETLWQGAANVLAACSKAAATPAPFESGRQPGRPLLPRGRDQAADCVQRWTAQQRRAVIPAPFQHAPYRQIKQKPNIKTCT